MDALERLTKLGPKMMQAQSEVREKRKVWNRVADEIILSALKEVIDAMLLDEYVWARRIRLFSNFESVQLSFAKRPNGIDDGDERGGSLGIEHGASLVFGQTTFGDVVVMAYPHHQELPKEGRNHVEPYFGPRFASPADITRLDVLKIVESFMRFACRSSIFFYPAVEGEEPDSGEWRESPQKAPYQASAPIAGFARS